MNNMSRERSKVKSSILCGICPDMKCRSKLYFPNFDTSIECTHCGQRHDRTSLQSVQEVSDLDARLNDMIRNILMSNIIPKRGTETVKVLGLSNYHCKLLSPLLTKYGMDKRTGQAKLLSEMNQGDIFDCGLFGDRAFLIDPEHVPVPGFGRDVTGSMNYLSQTLDLVKRVNGDEERLIPIHADGDGHCLVHAVSRALVGRELFWHPLRCSLKKHFEDNLNPYKELFKDFVDESDWRYIIDECDPDFVPPEGELLGLRNIHVFGLANVLKRPIILLDSLECMNSLGDYAALFLPSLIPPELCRGKNNRLNKPLCIAWSSSGHNHYIPLVGIKKKPLPVLPIHLLPKAWGVPQSQILTYMEFDEGSYCTIGGDRNLGDSYIMRLVSAMEHLFLENLGVHPVLVADVHHYLYQSTGVVAADREMVVLGTKKAVNEGRLYRCLSCDAVCEQVIKPQWFRAGGVLYNMALIQYGKFVPNELYPFPLHGIVCRYDAQRNELQPDHARSCLENCTWCNGKTLRKVLADGSILYKNEDKTRTPASSSTCGCGYKHYWCGKEYDNPPQKLNVILEWNNQILRDTVAWFERESDPNLNSNVYQVASEVVQKHFPGEFGSERLVQRVVEQLLHQTKRIDTLPADSEMLEDHYEIINDSLPANKIIMSGTGVLHKEELGLSEKECQILRKVQENAEVLQKRNSGVGKEDTPLISSALQSDLGNIGKENLMKSGVLHATEEQHHDRFVRVVTSDGRQGKLILSDEGVSYSKLRSWINDQFQIAPAWQRIKFGFPPQELQMPTDDSILPLSHGDRIIVELISSQKVSTYESGLRPTDTAESEKENQAVSNPTGKIVVDQWIKILDSLKGGDSSDVDLIHSLKTSLSNQLVWSCAKKMPHMFKRGGVFYEQVANDIGLTNEKHCSLASFPNKIFCYNVQSDSLELCVKPYGHFPVDTDVDSKISKASRVYGGQGSSTCHSQSLSGLVNAYGTVGLSTSVPDSCDKPTRDVSAEHEEKPLLQHSLIRKGPGYSVLGPPGSSPEVQVDKLQTLANQLTGGNNKSCMSDSAAVSKPGPDEEWRKTDSAVYAGNSLGIFLTRNIGDVPHVEDALQRVSDTSDPSGEVMREECAEHVYSSAASDSTHECDISKMDMDCL